MTNFSKISAHLLYQIKACKYTPKNNRLFSTKGFLKFVPIFGSYVNVYVVSIPIFDVAPKMVEQFRNVPSYEKSFYLQRYITFARFLLLYGASVAGNNVS